MPEVTGLRHHSSPPLTTLSFLRVAVLYEETTSGKNGTPVVRVKTTVCGSLATIPSSVSLSPLRTLSKPTTLPAAVSGVVDFDFGLQIHSQDHFTSLAVIGEPSENLALGLRVKVQVLASAELSHLSATPPI